MSLTLMTYNIRIGTWSPLGLEGIARVMEQVKPDIVGLQEVNRYGHQSGPVDQTRWLGERLGMQYVFGASRPTSDLWKTVPNETGAFGNALLTRFPILDWTVHPLPRPSETDEPRSLLGARLATLSGALNVLVTHWSLDFDHRQLQAVSTVEQVGTWHPGTPVVLMGDFNALHDSPEIAAIRQALTDGWEVAGVPMENRISFPSGAKGSVSPDGWSAALDYVFVGDGITVERIEVIRDESQASDHNPVVVRVQLQPSG